MDESSPYLPLVQGENYQILGHAQDYKRLNPGDDVSNTGGMGAISARELVSEDLIDKLTLSIIEPTLNGLKHENIHYSGFLFFGLIISLKMKFNLLNIMQG